jgi:putative glutamine amidotransferase
MNKPVIGITTSYGKHNEMMKGVYVHHDYHRTVAACGAVPILIPNASVDTALSALELLDGLIVSGGEDVNPQSYGQDPHPKLGPTFTLRDEIEMALIHAALGRGMPLLAICRGAQILNVALGGTLVQDIPSELPHAIQHTQQNPRGEDAHFVTIQSGSKLHTIFGETKVRVNSLHHQAIHQIAETLHSVAVASDGVIEAVEYANHPFALGIQWHPESMVAHGSAQMKHLFEAFAAAARND